MQVGGCPELNVIGVGVARGESEHVPINDGDLLRGQQVGGHPSVAGAGEDIPAPVRAGPGDGGADLAYLIGVNHDRQFPAHIRQHGFPGGDDFERGDIPFACGVLRLGVCLCFLEEILDRTQPGAAFFGLVIQ